MWALAPDLFLPLLKSHNPPVQPSTLPDRVILLCVFGGAVISGAMFYFMIKPPTLEVSFLRSPNMVFLLLLFFSRAGKKQEKIHFLGLLRYQLEVCVFVLIVLTRVLSHDDPRRFKPHHWPLVHINGFVFGVVLRAPPATTAGMQLYGQLVTGKMLSISGFAFPASTVAEPPTQS